MPGFFVGGSGPNSIIKKTGGVTEAWYEACQSEKPFIAKVEFDSPALKR
jgi:hypothetical protein